MKANSAVTAFQRDCFANYLSDIQREIDGFPNPYLYPDGNPIRPVVPVQTTVNKIMLVGAFPSARFEKRKGKLIPIADNLAPFGPELYFDGFEVRIQESTDSLERNYFPQLGIDRDDLWITDLVKVYLYPKKHLKNFDSSEYLDTHRLFPKIARASGDWFRREASVCNPKLIITLGEVVAKVVAGPKASLDGKVRPLHPGMGCDIVHLAHPEARRWHQEWDKGTARQLADLAQHIVKYV